MSCPRDDLFRGSESRASTRNLAVRLLALWLIFPFVATLAFPVVNPFSHPKYLFHPTYLILWVPATVLLAGQGISILSGVAPRRRWIGGVRSRRLGRPDFLLFGTRRV